jgi:ferredoxin-NADP reductase
VEAVRRSALPVYTARLLARRPLATETFEIVFERPEGFVFRAGQHVRLAQGGLDRSYTPASGQEDPELGFCIRRIPHGPATSFLHDLEIGATVSFTGPHGYFTYQTTDRGAVFVATGTGIAPFASMARSGVTGFTLLHGVSTVEDLYYRELLTAPAARYAGCIPGAGRGAAGDPAAVAERRMASGGAVDLFDGRVTEYLVRAMPPGRYDFYLCGSGEMIRDVINLADQRFPDSRVFVESFF